MNVNATKVEHLGTEKIGKLLWEMSSQTTFSLLVYAIYSITDTYFLSVGINSLAAAGASIISPVLIALGGVATIVGVGGIFSIRGQSQRSAHPHLWRHPLRQSSGSCTGCQTVYPESNLGSRSGFGIDSLSCDPDHVEELPGEDDANGTDGLLSMSEDGSELSLLPLGAREYQNQEGFGDR